MRILVLGDSLGLPRPHRINSYSPDEKELAVSYNQTYPSLIQRYFLEKYSFTPYIELINRSKRLCTIKDIYNEFHDYLFFYEPDIIILQIGIVDCWFRENNKQLVKIGDFEKYFIDIREMLLLRPNCKLIIVGISPTSFKMNERYDGLNKEITDYNNVYKKFVDFTNIFYIDMESYVKPADIHTYLLPDDHHLNSVGNKLVATKVQNIVESMIINIQGCRLYEKADLEGALAKFEEAYRYYPYNIDNTYNYLLLLVEFNKSENMKDVIEFCKSNLDDREIFELIYSL